MPERDNREVVRRCRFPFLCIVLGALSLGAVAGSSADGVPLAVAVGAPDTITAPTIDRPVVVAIVDDAFRMNHHDLRGRLWTNPKETAGNGIDDDGNGFIDDVHGWDVVDNDISVTPPPGREAAFNHGTYLAGIVLAAARTVLGPSTNDVIRILPVKAVSDHARNMLVKKGYEGIAYAVDAGADIVVCAWGAQRPGPEEQAILARARERGVLVVAAAGNVSQELEQFPAALSDVLSVTALDSTGCRWERATYDRTVDIAVLGDSLSGPDSRSDTDFIRRSGTSGAVAIVAGVAAAVKAVRPRYTAAQISLCLMSSAHSIERHNRGVAGKIGAGAIDVAAALRCELFSPPRALRQMHLSVPHSALSLPTRRFDAARFTVAPGGAYHGFTFYPHAVGGQSPLDASIAFSVLDNDSVTVVAHYEATALPESVFVAGDSVRVSVGKGRNRNRVAWVMPYRAQPIDSSTLFCSGETILELSSDTFSDGSGQHLYAGGCSCKWLIRAPEGKRIRLWFTEFDTEARTDWVYLFEGDGTQAPIHAALSGPNIPPIIQSRGTTLLVWFVTDRENNGAGWRARYIFF